MAPIATEDFCSDSLPPRGRKPSYTVFNAENEDQASALAQVVMDQHIRSTNTDTCQPGEEDAFFVADLGEVYRQHLRWKMHLCRVTPHYAVKCNPDPTVVSLLATLGVGFDCASKAEIDLVLELGVDPSQIIYAQPCKTKSYLRWAAQMGVNKMTFDNEDELFKIRAHHPSAELVLRLMTDDSGSLCRLSQKFGAPLESARSLLDRARQLHLNVVGVSFHVGSGATDPGAFMQALRDSQVVFEMARVVGYDLKILDIGGGFSSSTFENLAADIAPALDEMFPPSVSIIAEPGRYYVADAFSLACNVIARRECIDETTGGRSYMLYLNDGVYGNFSNIIFDHQHPTASLLSFASSVVANEAGRRRSSGYTTVRKQSIVSVPPQFATSYSLWGPTCDGIDIITSHCTFPQTQALLGVGDWLCFNSMGAYTKCSATEFNGFPNRHKVLYCCTEMGAAALLHGLGIEVRT